MFVYSNVNFHVLIRSNTSCTFPFENQKNIYRFAVSPDGLIMISVDEGMYYTKQKKANSNTAIILGI